MSVTPAVSRPSLWWGTLEKGGLTVNIIDFVTLAQHHGHEAMAAPWQGMGGTTPPCPPRDLAGRPSKAQYCKVPGEVLPAGDTRGPVRTFSDRGKSCARSLCGVGPRTPRRPPGASATMGQVPPRRPGGRQSTSQILAQPLRAGPRSRGSEATQGWALRPFTFA